MKEKKVKHLKITNSDKKEFIDQSLRNGSSYREISETLKGQGFSISHAAIMNYDKDHMIKETSTEVIVGSDQRIDLDKINEESKSIDTNGLEKKISDGIARELLMIESMRKSGTAMSRDIEMAQKALSVYEKGQNLMNRTHVKFAIEFLDWVEENIGFNEKQIIADALQQYFTSTDYFS